MRIITAIARASSRRAFLAMFGASAIAPAAFGQSIVPGQALPQTPTPVPGQNPPSDSDIARIAAGTDLSRHLTIAVMINDKGPYHFVVDTGAELSVLADNVAQALGLVNGKRSWLTDCRDGFPPRWYG